MAQRANAVVFFRAFVLIKNKTRKVCVCLEEGGRKWAWRGKTDLRIKEATEYKINHLLLLQKKEAPVCTYTQMQTCISL